MSPFFVVGGPISLDELKRLYVARVLELTGGNMTETARILEVDRKSVIRWKRDNETPMEVEA